MEKEKKFEDADNEVEKAIQELQIGLNNLNIALKKVKARGNVVANEERRKQIRVGDKVRITNNI